MATGGTFWMQVDIYLKESVRYSRDRLLTQTGVLNSSGLPFFTPCRLSEFKRTKHPEKKDAFITAVRRLARESTVLTAAKKS
jgi:hypothetical protein